MDEAYLPTCARKRYSCYKCVVEIRNVDPEIVECHSFGARLIAQALDGVELLERRVSGRVHEAEEEDKCDHSASLRV